MTSTKSVPSQLPLTPVPLDELKPFLAIDVNIGGKENGGDDDGDGGGDGDGKNNKLKVDYYKDIFGWIKQSDDEMKALKEERDEIGAANLFGGDSSSDDDDEDADGGNNDADEEVSLCDSDASDADYLGFKSRVRVWTSSTKDVDGYGGTISPRKGSIVYSKRCGLDDESNENNSQQHLTAIYVLSEAWEGWGFLLWASARHLGNSFACPVKCRELLYGPAPASGSSGVVEDGSPPLPEPPRRRALHHHPLHNSTVLELGAGCGLPSLIAMQCQTSAVICTDLDLPNRIRCIGESLYRTTKYLLHESKSSAPAPARSVPYKWGKSTQQVLSTLQYMIDNTTGEEKLDGVPIISNPSRRFDVICSTDCLFMPHLHIDLLQSIDELLKTGRDDEEESESENPGVCVLAFAIHAAYSKSDEVWSFVEKAKSYKCRYNMPFKVEIMNSTQLTPPKKGMESEQGLVHVIRLTRSRPL